VDRLTKTSIPKKWISTNHDIHPHDEFDPFIEFNETTQDATYKYQIEGSFLELGGFV